jgi:hypothetical protein
MSDDLHNRAKESAKGFVVPDEWGEQVQLEVGEFFDGRHRGFADGGKSGAWLLWGDNGELLFIWNAYRLQQGYDRENPSIGDRVVIFRDEDYRTQYDAEGEASGLGYGVATKPCSDPLPEGGASEADDGIPFLCPAGGDTRPAPAAVAGTAPA